MGNPQKVTAQHFFMNEFPRRALLLWRVFIDFTRHVELEDYGILVRRHAGRIAVLEEGWGGVEWYEPNAMCENFVLNDGGVVPNIDVFYGHCRYLYHALVHVQCPRNSLYLCYHDSPERICNRRIDTDEVKLHRPLRQPFHLHLECLCNRRDCEWSLGEA